MAQIIAHHMNMSNDNKKSAPKSREIADVTIVKPRGEFIISPGDWRLVASIMTVNNPHKSQPSTKPALVFTEKAGNIEVCYGLIADDEQLIDAAGGRTWAVPPLSLALDEWISVPEVIINGRIGPRVEIPPHALVKLHHGGDNIEVKPITTMREPLIAFIILIKWNQWVKDKVPNKERLEFVFDDKELNEFTDPISTFAKTCKALGLSKGCEHNYDGELNAILQAIREFV